MGTNVRHARLEFTMKIVLIIAGCIVLLAILYATLSGSRRPRNAKSRTSLHDLDIYLIDGKRKSMADFKGKKLLIVNVASQCGFTPQYQELEKLYNERRGKLEILGIPSNDFMGQEPGTNEEISNFCKVRYGVTFWLSQKVAVKGDGKVALYRWLTEKELNGWNDKSPKWNFYKYLIDESGELMGVFPSTVSPMSDDILKLL